MLSLGSFLGLGWNEGQMRTDIRESWRFQKGWVCWLLKAETCARRL